MAVLLETSIGDIVVDLYVEERPKCAINFLKLCKAKYYNYSLFYSVQRNFIAQVGDPLGTGQGGQSIWGLQKGEEFKYFEAATVPRLKHIKTGTLSMVNDGNGRHGSQFFLTLGENLNNLDGMHTVFGELTEGMEVLAKMNEIYCDKDGRPFQDIRIYHTVILEDPFDDLEGLEIPDRSPSPPKVITDSNRIGAEEDIEEYKGLTEDQIRELVEQREAKANAQVLEMVGDIPDADAKPPENVLFVCKLNPVTTDEDLEIIFSRFGPILSCEVIRDQKTEDSLQYAFIEFENEEDCIKAYFKMDNVLIDDRRIHVDFSQSLAKVKGITRRKYSEEESAAKGKERNRKGDDGLVSRRKSAQDDGGYEMVFNDEEEDVTSRKQARMSERREQGDNGVRDSRRKREKEKGREEHERKIKEKEKDSRHHSHRESRSYDRKHNKSRSRSHDMKHKRSRSRSHDRKHKRSRSRSHDRKHKRSRSKSHDRKHKRSRSRSHDRKHKRSRSRSHDRKHRSRSHERKAHRKSHDRHKRRDRSRSIERFRRK